MTDSLSIIVPAYNEAATLEQTLPRIHERFPDAELIVVGDGCRDDTGARSCGLGFPVTYIEYHPNRGKGYAIRQGMLAAHGDLAVFTDADLPFGADGVQQVVDVLRDQSLRVRRRDRQQGAATPRPGLSDGPLGRPPRWWCC